MFAIDATLSNLQGLLHSMLVPDHPLALNPQHLILFFPSVLISYSLTCPVFVCLNRAHACLCVCGGFPGGLREAMDGLREALDSLQGAQTDIITYGRGPL